jgi:hypothetical protein
MPATLEDVTRQALELTDRQRLALAGFLLEMHEPVDQSGVDEAWEREIQDRIEEIDSGNAKGISYLEVMREAEQRLAP